MRDFWRKSVGAVSKKSVLDYNLPGGGARGGPCDKSGLEVVICTQGVCVQSLALIGAMVAEIRVGPKV